MILDGWDVSASFRVNFVQQLTGVAEGLLIVFKLRVGCVGEWMNSIEQIEGDFTVPFGLIVA